MMWLRSLLSASVLASSFVFAAPQDRTTEQGEASITNAAEECQVYYYPPVAEQKYNFPTIWQPAFILSNDTDAMSKFNALNSTIPAIAPHGTQPGSLTGNFTGVNYTAADPDCWWTWSHCDTPKIDNLPPDLTRVPEPDTFGYGFDDGPNCSHNAFYDFLAENNQKATMFYIGSNVMDWPLEAQRAIADGHQVCVHTWSHRYMTALTNEQVFAEFYYTIKAIKLVLGVTPNCWRPPFGDVDDRVRYIAHSFNLSTVVWQFDSNDWRAGTGNITDADVDANYESFIEAAKNGSYATEGSIMLTHELNNFTMSEAVKYYSQLKDAFKHLVPIAVALNDTTPYAEKNYTMPTFEQYTSGTTTTGSSGSSTGSGSGTGSGSSGGGSSGAARSSWSTLGVALAGAAAVLSALA